MSTERVWLFQKDHSIFLAKKIDSGKHLSGYTIGGNIRLLTKSNHDAKLFYRWFKHAITAGILLNSICLALYDYSD